MASKEQEIAIKIAADIERSFGQSINEVNTKLTKMSNVAKKVATVAAGAFAAIKIKDFASDCIEAAIGFENSMSDVAKVVDGLRTENGTFTEEYYKMGDALTEMSKRIPMTTEELAQITAAAGQANIAKEELLQFTETASKMGVAFDTTAEQAGQWMAVWRTSLNLTQSEVEALGDQINYLGNTSSEDANKISEIITEVGSLAKISGVSAKDLAALSAATTGINSNVAATGLKNMFVAMGAGTSATNAQVKVLKKLGFSAEEMAQKMQVDAQGAILELLEAINQLPKAEQEAAIKNYFGKESLNTVAVLSGNLDNLKEQFKKVGDASLYAGSMQGEFATKADTTENSIVLAKNAITALKKQLGTYLLPVVGKVATGFGKIVDSVSDLITKADPQIKAFKDRVTTYGQNIISNISTYRGSLLNGLNEVKTVAVNTFQNVRNKISENEPTIQKLISVADDLKDKLFNAFNSCKPTLIYLFEQGLPYVVDKAFELLDVATSVYNFINDNWTLIGPIAKGLGIAIAGIKMVKFAKGVIDATKALTMLKVAQVTDKVETLYLQALYAKDAIVRGASTVAIWAQNAALTAYNIVTGIASAVTTALGVAFAFLTSPIGLVILAITAVIAVGVLLYKNWDKVKEVALNVWGSICNFFTAAKDNICGVLDNLAEKFPGVFGLISGYFNNWKEMINGVIDGVKQIFSGLIDFVTGIFTGNWGQAWTGVTEIFGGIFETIGSIAKRPLNNIIDMINFVIGKISGIHVDIPDWVPGIGGNTFGINIPQIPHLAKGGIATRSTLAEIGEGSEPEAVLPLSKLANLINGYIEDRKVGSQNKITDLTGDVSAANEQPIIITYSPTHNFYGNAPSKEEIVEAESMSQDKFNRMMDNYLRSKRRTQFG